MNRIEQLENKIERLQHKLTAVQENNRQIKHCVRVFLRSASSFCFPHSPELKNKDNEISSVRRELNKTASGIALLKAMNYDVDTTW